MDKATLDFLKKLKANNSKEWFNENRKLYDAALADFTAFVDELIGRLVKIDPALKGLSPRDCLFRIYRDVRFSKNKLPYKTNLGALIAPGGRKLMKGGLYVHIEPGDNSMLAGGLYLPPTKELNVIRTAIGDDPAAFKKILNAAAFKKLFGELWGDKLKSAPRGFAKDHPDIELLKFKSYTVAHMAPDKEVIVPDFMKVATNAFKTLQPFNNFLTKAAAGSAGRQ